MNATNVTTGSQSDCATFQDSGTGDNFFMIVWVMLGVVFILFPFCSTAGNRKLWARRIRERRWIQETDEDDWYSQMMRDRQSRRQPPPAAYPMLGISPIQGDEMRKEYLLKLFENYTLTLSQSDIHESSMKSQAIISTKEAGQDEASSVLPTSTNSNDDVDIESPPIVLPEEYDHDEALKELGLDETDLFVYVPVAGKKLEKSDSDTLESDDDAAATPVRKRQAPSGCAVCLSQFCANERITWSSNAQCSHVFHQDCLLRWFQAVGSKHQAKQLQLCPTMTEKEALDLLTTFPKLCPCCRRTFCAEMEHDIKIPSDESMTSTDDSSGIAGSDRMIVDLQSEM